MSFPSCVKTVLFPLPRRILSAPEPVVRATSLLIAEISKSTALLPAEFISILTRPAVSALTPRVKVCVVSSLKTKFSTLLTFAKSASLKFPPVTLSVISMVSLFKPPSTVSALFKLSAVNSRRSSPTPALITSSPLRLEIVLAPAFPLIRSFPVVASTRFAPVVPKRLISTTSPTSLIFVMVLGLRSRLFPSATSTIKRSLVPTEPV